jgi:hypothetical protein
MFTGARPPLLTLTASVVPVFTLEEHRKAEVAGLLAVPAL